MSHSPTRSGAAALTLAAALFLAPACNDGGGVSEDTVAKLTEQVAEAKRLNEQMADRLDRLERKLDGFRQDVDQLHRRRVAAELDEQNAAVAEDGGEGGEGLAAAGAMGGGDLAAMLETEDGKAAVAKAMEAIEQKRNDERRQRMVSAMVDRFAEQANLTEAQTVDVNRILGDSMKKIGDVWSSMRDTGDVSAEQRATLREDNMMKMEEIRLATDEEMKAVLDADQYAIYEEQSARMRGWGGGGGRRGR